jgi:transcriptional regulator with XRE-family HTH domain
MAMGEVIAKYRQKKGWTQKELASHLYVSDKAVSRWEKGDSYPDPQMIKNLSVLLEIPLNELFEGVSVQNDPTKAFKEKKEDERYLLQNLTALLFSLVGFVLALGMPNHFRTANLSSLSPAEIASNILVGCFSVLLGLAGFLIVLYAFFSRRSILREEGRAQSRNLWIWLVSLLLLSLAAIGLGATFL